MKINQSIDDDFLLSLIILFNGSQYCLLINFIPGELYMDVASIQTNRQITCFMVVEAN